MAASHQQVAPLVSRVERLVKQQDVAFDHVGAEVIEVTNKRVFIWCPDKVASRNLAFRLNDEGFALEIRKGLKSQAYYIQVFL
jgi:hypothetical protein